ncbi:thiamine phosphate synthase [Mangrovihabitans endophyticus]|uniref:thiamine phosphate synthase n=1 Tax=Mangrovihabitans endophyticus TaxID=1751298 RepID=UPI0016698114|nr:thiamine phosphate synthase [Mangrovihabitans endophyticus]
MVTPSGLVVLTDRTLSVRPLPETVAAAVRGGAEWVLLRERDLPPSRRTALAAALRAVLPPGRLIVAGPDPLGGNAVHLAERDRSPAESGERPALVGRSCHAPAPGAEGGTSHSDVDYVTVSPVYPTTTKPGYGPALTPAGAAAIAGDRRWLALGGIDTADRARACADAGAAGIAVLGAVMRASDPERVAGALSAAFADARARTGVRSGR